MQISIRYRWEIRYQGRSSPPHQLTLISTTPQSHSFFATLRRCHLPAPLEGLASMEKYMDVIYILLLIVYVTLVTHVFGKILEGKVCKLKYRFYLWTHRVFSVRWTITRILEFSLLSSVNGIRMKTYLVVKLAIKLLVWRCVKLQVNCGSLCNYGKCGKKFTEYFTIR